MSNDRNVVQDKSYMFALRIVKLHGWLRKNKQEYVLAKQLLRAGTSIGANVEEAIGAHSDRDFLSKMTIAYKEARETRYWLRLLNDSDLLDGHGDAILQDVEELLRLLGAITRTMRAKIHQ